MQSGRGLWDPARFLVLVGPRLEAGHGLAHLFQA